MTEGCSRPKERRDGDLGGPEVGIRKEGSLTCEKERPPDVEGETWSWEAVEEGDGRSTFSLDGVGLTGEDGADI